jgi:hypothetical protein
LLSILLVLQAVHRPAFRQVHPFQCRVTLVLGHLCAISRHTITQLLVALGIGGAGWSAYY